MRDPIRELATVLLRLLLLLLLVFLITASVLVT